MNSIFLSCLRSLISVAAIVLFPSIVHPVTLDSDIEVLRLLKLSIDPSTIVEFSFLDSWNFSLDPCEATGHFLGILCTYPDDDNSTKRVTSIDLDSVGYDGFLTPSIGNLTQLTILNLGRNNFRGPLPGSLSSLRELTTLTALGNFFTGSIPAGVTRLKKLETVDLSFNMLTGTIPAKFSGLRRLTHLSLAHNELSGRIPDLTGSWQLLTLELDSNQLFGYLPKFPVNLRTLSLSHNSLSGHISSIGRLVNLRSLDLSCNMFSGPIAQEIFMLPNVVRINVSVNHFTEIDVIKFAGRETHLQDFDAHENLLWGPLPDNLVTLRNLTTINLARNRFSGPIPQNYGDTVGNSWRSLFLDHNFLTGNLPPQFQRSTMRIKGSLAKNCLRCPSKMPLCNGGQRPGSECYRQSHGS